MKTDKAIPKKLKIPKLIWTTFDEDGIYSNGVTDEEENEFLKLSTETIELRKLPHSMGVDIRYRSMPVPKQMTVDLLELEFDAMKPVVLKLKVKGFEMCNLLLSISEFSFSANTMNQIKVEINPIE